MDTKERVEIYILTIFAVIFAILMNMYFIPALAAKTSMPVAAVSPESWDTCINGFAYNTNEEGVLEAVMTLPDRYKRRPPNYPIQMDVARCGN